MNFWHTCGRRTAAFCVQHGRNLAAALGLATLAGCAAGPSANIDLMADFEAAKPPAFLTGSATALLLYTNGFSAHLVVTESGTNRPAGRNPDRLLGQGSKLLYAPGNGKEIFLWDVVQRRGYLVHEALQGYAPFSAPGLITNIVATEETSAGSAAAPVNGHPARPTEVTVLLNTGAADKYKVFCANDFGDFPVRIKARDTNAPYTLDLADLRLEQLSPHLFQPPEEFTKYSSVEALLSEIAARQAGQRREKADKPGDKIRAMPSPMIHH